MLEERFTVLHKGAAIPEQDKNPRLLLFSHMVLSFRDIEHFFFFFYNSKSKWLNLNSINTKPL